MFHTALVTTALALCLPFSVSAQDLDAVFPQQDNMTLYYTNQVNHIQWTVQPAALNAGITTLRLVFGTGSGVAVTELFTIVDGLPFPDTLSYDWFAPGNITTGATNYTVVFKGISATGTQLSTSYATWFHFAAGNGTAPPPVVTTSTAPADTTTVMTSTTVVVTSSATVAPVRSTVATSTVKNGGVGSTARTGLVATLAVLMFACMML
ncbi:hypothetical protein HK101_009959 [Irineochytrium annulatum]|nr:hypothetical protein HK101_009959 [Irineochytrium annulatum]